MYEYECYRCFNKTYSSAPYEYLERKECEHCGGRLYYSLEQIEKFDTETKKRALSKLEKILRIENNLRKLDKIINTYAGEPETVYYLEIVMTRDKIRYEYRIKEYRDEKYRYLKRKLLGQ